MAGNGNGRFMNPNAPSLALCELYERVNAQGRRYLVGRVGTLKFACC